MRSGSREYPLESESALPKKPFGFGSFETVTATSDCNGKLRPNFVQSHGDFEQMHTNSVQLHKTHHKCEQMHENMGESDERENVVEGVYTFANVYKCTREESREESSNTILLGGEGHNSSNVIGGGRRAEGDVGIGDEGQRGQSAVLSIRIPRGYYEIYRKLPMSDRFVFKELVKAILRMLAHRDSSRMLGAIKMGLGTINLNINVDAKLQRELEVAFSRRDSIRELKEQLKRKDEMIRELERENDRLREEIKELEARYSNAKSTYETYRHAIIEIMNRHPNLREEIMDILRKGVRGKQLWTFMEGREAH